MDDGTRAPSMMIPVALFLRFVVISGSLFRDGCSDAAAAAADT